MFKPTTRGHFGILFNEVFLTGVGAEVGVQNGFNSLRILRYWKGKIICVDTWIKEEEFFLTQINLCGTKAILLKGTSTGIAKSIADNSLDWVYIDAGHSFAEVKADYEAWLPKVRTGGIISGHDYGDNDCIGVKQFMDQLGIPFELTTEDLWEGREYQSWWFIKPFPDIIGTQGDRAAEDIT